MTEIWVPPDVSRELRDGTREHNASLGNMFRFTDPVCAAWNPVLFEIDPLLKLGKALDGAFAPGVLPGFYHLVRMIPDAPWWVQPLTGPSGEFAEPTSAMLDMLRANDLQNARARMDRELAQERARREQEAQVERDREERHQEIEERVAALTRTQVSMNPDAPWGQNARGAALQRSRKRK